MDREAWHAAVQGVTESDATEQLGNNHSGVETVGPKCGLPQRTLEELPSVLTLKVLVVSREDPNYSMDQGPDPLGRHGNSWMSWGWTIRRWVEPTDGNCLQKGSHVQTGAGSTSTPEACPGRGWGGFQSVLGPHARVQARGPFPSRSRSLFNLGVITTPFVFLLKWFSQVTFNYSKTLPHTDHVPEYISNWFSVTPLHTHSLQCPKL